ncbi:MAG: hypothetical protein CMB99_02175 [Flavobacteriaceae bacterium]|nr:hypothetical protein [Flavobacteriaceae bacterium]|tara:strand:+ start:2283 stop:2744 length:462 start_codon:yes stop_codon:yes gene_type:complete
MAEETNKIGFALKRITTEQFAIIESAFTDGKLVDLKAGLRFGINFENKIISVVFSTNLIQDKSPFLIIEVGCHFSIREEAWDIFYNQDKAEIIVPRGFIGHLVMLTIGTTRGVLHGKTENTPFNNFLLPTLNVNEMVKKDVVFKIEVEKKESK